MRSAAHAAAVPASRYSLPPSSLSCLRRARQWTSTSVSRLHGSGCKAHHEAVDVTPQVGAVAEHALAAAQQLLSLSTLLLVLSL